MGRGSNILVNLLLVVQEPSSNFSTSYVSQAGVRVRENAPNCSFKSEEKYSSVEVTDNFHRPANKKSAKVDKHTSSSSMTSCIFLTKPYLSTLGKAREYNTRQGTEGNGNTDSKKGGGGGGETSREKELVCAVGMVLLCVLRGSFLMHACVCVFPSHLFSHHVHTTRTRVIHPTKKPPRHAALERVRGYSNCRGSLKSHARVS